MDALEKTREYAEGAPEADQMAEDRIAAENERALAQLESQMRGLGR